MFFLKKSTVYDIIHYYTFYIIIQYHDIIQTYATSLYTISTSPNSFLLPPVGLRPSPTGTLLDLHLAELREEMHEPGCGSHGDPRFVWEFGCEIPSSFLNWWCETINGDLMGQYGINIMDKIIGCSNLGEYADIINGHKWENI